MHNYRKLEVWQKAHALAVSIRQLTDRMVKRGNTDLISQMRRAALSVPENIVEGSTRSSDKDFARHLQIAAASASELEYHLQFAAEAGIIRLQDFDFRRLEVIDIRKMLVGLIQRMNPSVHQNSSESSKSESS